MEAEDQVVEEQQQDFENGEVEEDDAKTLLDQLRKERKESAEDLETLIPVPGYDTIPLLIKYKMLDGYEIDKISRKVQKQSRDRWTRNLMGAIDVMIAAATGVFVDYNGEVKPLTFNGVPILGFTPELAEYLDFKATTAREVVIGTFQNKDMHVANHSLKLQRWFGDTNASVDEEWLGE